MSSICISGNTEGSHKQVLDDRSHEPMPSLLQGSTFQRSTLLKRIDTMWKEVQQVWISSCPFVGGGLPLMFRSTPHEIRFHRLWMPESFRSVSWKCPSCMPDEIFIFCVQWITPMASNMRNCLLLFQEVGKVWRNCLCFLSIEYLTNMSGIT